MKKYKGYQYPTTVEELSQFGDETVINVPIGGVDVRIEFKAHIPEDTDLTDKMVEDIVSGIVIDYVDNVMDGVGIIADAKTEAMADMNVKVEAAIEDFKEKHGLAGGEGDQKGKISNEQLAKVAEDVVNTKIHVVDELKADDTVLTTTITEEQLKQVEQVLEENVENNENLKAISELPSNNGKEERTEDEVEAGEKNEAKMVNIDVDPNTGENRMLQTFEKELEEDTFEKIIEEADFDSIDLERELTTADVVDFMAKGEKSGAMISELAKDSDFSEDQVKNAIEIANRLIKKEEFNIYRALCPETKNMIDGYIKQTAGIVPMDQSQQAKMYRNSICKSLFDDFIYNINYDRVKADFGKELETIFNKGMKEISSEIIGYSKAKIAAYRESAEKIDDPVKKEKLNGILDQIDEAYNMETLKEYSKKCKIKKFDLEKPGKIYDGFLRKYEGSQYNVYNINLAVPILLRSLNAAEFIDVPEYTKDDVNAFFIAFCRQTMNFSPNNVMEHAYMYYLLYNIVLYDVNNNGEGNEDVTKFMDNIKEVIKNLRQRNNNFN